jgi:hypothetical protein
MIINAYPYYYAWKNNPQMGLYPCPKRLTLYKRACRIVGRGRMNSCLVEFENGQRECVSRNAVRLLSKKT